MSEEVTMFDRKSFLCILGAAAAVLVALGPSRPGSAHTLPLTDRQLAAVSTDVVVAVVESSRSRWNAGGTLIVTDYALRIEDRLKGGAPERLTLTIPGGTVGGETHGTCVSTPLAEGARYVLFLDRPEGSGVSPVTGGWQGVFREIAGADGKRRVGRGRSRAIVVSPGTGEPVELDDFIRSVRRLVHSTPALSEAAEASGSLAPIWPVREPLAAAKAELVGIADQEPGAKAFVRNAPIPPLAFSTFLPGTPFEGVDQQEMEKWNRYAADLFQVSPAAVPWSFGNGVSEIVGFPSEAELQLVLGRGWGRGATSLVAWRIQNDHIVEADIAFNPAQSWSLDDAETSQQGGPLPFRDHLLAELASAWGDEGPFDPFDFPNFPVVSRDSVKNFRPQAFEQAVLLAEDAEAVRSTYPGTAVRDGLISSYIVVPSSLTPFYVEVRPSVATVRRGGHFLLTSVKIENPGTVTLVNPVVEVYLVPQRLSLDGAILLKRSTFRLSLASGAAQNLSPGTITVPSKTPPGTYYFAFILRDPKDAYQDNNTAWSFARLTVTK
ncbi:MAG TPA: hypothetical protein VLX28_18900 [Thermoanaerobaculia bacterium]|nr:hypothetical protein [Thermoanaerobaculia bacterium]